MSETVAVGIDLGTTSSSVGVFQNGKVEIIANERGSRSTPSYVAFTDTNILIGDAAKDEAAANPVNTLFNVKRLIGRKFNDPRVQSDMKYWPFKIIDADRPKYQVEYKNEEMTFFAEEISSMVLTKMKKTAEVYLGRKVTDAVITVPAFFNDIQRQATKEAGLIAGLNVLRIMNESTAAAIAYGLDKKVESAKNAFIFDLGGGTFDMSVVNIENGIFEVISKFGDTHLGGDDFNTAMVDYCVAEFQRKHKKDITASKHSLSTLWSACESAKRTLSTSPEASIEVESLFEGIDFSTTLTRARFNEICWDLVHSILAPLENSLKIAGIRKSDIDEIVLVGGSTRIPEIQHFLSNFFNKKELSEQINPDEAVAYGAAIQAAALAGAKDDVLTELILLDVIPRSLGFGTIGGSFTRFAERNSVIPLKKVVDYSTPSDDQADLVIHVFEGERSRANENDLVGQFDLSGIAPAPRGEPRIQVTYEVDANGILNVSAVEKRKDTVSKITVSDDRGFLIKEDVEKKLTKVEALLNGDVN